MKVEFEAMVRCRVVAEVEDETAEILDIDTPTPEPAELRNLQTQAVHAARVQTGNVRDYGRKK